ncbi:MAG: mechanosensitive ion channel family protein [Bacteroidota bacterium]
MWEFFNTLLNLTEGWNYPLLIGISTLGLNLVTYKIYNNLKIWLYKTERYILNAFIEAIYLPFLLFTWISAVRTLYHIDSVLSFVSLNDNVLMALQKTTGLMLANWFMMRFIISMQRSFSSDYLKNEKMINFLIRLFYYMLLLLSIVGALNLLGITLSERLTAIGYSFITINFVVVLLYFSHIVCMESAKIFGAKGFFLKQVVVQTLRDPIKLLIVGIGFNFIIETWLSIGYISAMRPFFELVSSGGVILTAFFWMLYKFTGLIEEHLLLGHLTERYPDKSMVHTSSKFSRVLILIVGGIIIFVRFNKTSLFTVFGSSAVVLAIIGLMGRDVFLNYFSGFIIYMEDRFKLGDWVYSVDKKIEGEIESIDLRSTSIRTFDKRLLIVPNALFISNALCNASKMTNRRIRETIGIERVSREVVEKITQDIRIMLQNHSGIDENQRRMAHFTQFTPYALNIELYVFTKTRDFQTYRNVQQDVFLKIMEIIDQNGAKLAFPTRTLHVKESSPKEIIVSE